MGTSSSKSKSKTNKKKASKKPWYKNKVTRISILVALAVFAFIAIFVASLQIRMEAPIILMTSHDYSNIIAFNANSGAFITTTLLDLSQPSKDLDLPTYVKQNKIQFRSIITRNYNQITVVNGNHHLPFIATFDCNKEKVPGWKINTFFGNHNKSLAHPYGLTWYAPNRWWMFTTQDTSSLFIFTESGKPVSIPGMMQHFPGAVFTLVNQTDGVFMDTYIPHLTPFKFESAKEQKWDLKKKHVNGGIRGVAVDTDLGLIFVAAEMLGKILVFDLTNEFNNSFNITLSSVETLSPISVINGAPYFEHTLFITERQSSDGVWAVRYTQNGYTVWWRAEQVPNLVHATGLTVAPDSLFVLSQGSHSILRYSPYTGRYIGQIVHFENNDVSGIISHKGIGKVGNTMENRRTLGEQLLYIPAGKMCSVT